MVEFPLSITMVFIPGIDHRVGGRNIGAPCSSHRRVELRLAKKRLTPRSTVVVPATGDEEVIHRVRSETWEHEGVVYTPGDPIRIKDLQGKFSFRSHEVNEKINSEWINVFQEGYYLRSFRLDRVVVPRKKKGQRGQVNASPASVCSEHKSYRAIRKPRTQCSRCWAAYEAKGKEENVNLSAESP